VVRRHDRDGAEPHGRHDRNRTYLATFAIDNFPLNVTASAGGSVQRVPDLAAYDYGSSAKITAVPDPNFHFIGWTGDTTTTGNPLTITVTGARSYNAQFAIDTHTLTVTAGANGQVAKSPDETSYDHGTQVTVAATPDKGYHFAVWSGDTVSTDNPLTFNLVADRSLTASFVLNQYPLTTDVKGSGTVVRDPDLPTYTHGTTVTLTASPDVGWHFVQWLGDVTTPNNPITVLMEGPHVENPVFEINTYAISLSPGPNGTIEVYPDQPSYPHGTALTVAANPAPGYTLDSWGGDLSGSDPTEDVVVDHPLTISATFKVQTFPIDVVVHGAGTVTKTPDAPDYPVGSNRPARRRGGRFEPSLHALDGQRERDQSQGDAPGALQHGRDTRGSIRTCTRSRSPSSAAAR
jgi:hypothetical protein